MCSKVKPPPMGLIRFAVVLTLFVLGCSDSPRTPTVPDRSLNSVRVESVSTSITAGDYRTFSIRVRVNETSGASVVLSGATLQFAGDGSTVTRTFANIPRNTIGPGETVDLDDLAVDDPQHQLDAPRRIVAAITYSTASGHIGAATGTGPFRIAPRAFDVWTVEATVWVNRRRCAGGLEAGCSPMYYPLDGSQVSGARSTRTSRACELRRF